MSSPQDAVDAFLADTNPSAGRASRKGCCTCKLPNAAELSAAMRHFASKKESGETTQSWRDFHKLCLVPVFKYPFGRDAMRDHCKECLGI